MFNMNWAFLALVNGKYGDSSQALWSYLTTQHQQLNSRTTVIGAKFNPADQVLREHTYTARNGAEMTIAVAYDPVDDMLYVDDDA